MVMKAGDPRPRGPHPLDGYPRPPPRGKDLPFSDGDKMESERHVLQMTLLIESLSYGWRHRQDFYVGGDMFVYYSEAQSRKNDFRGPDVFVVLGAERKIRDSWVVWEEDGRLPTAIIELLSPSTESIDRGEKMRLYSKVLRVPCYVLYDPYTQVFEGYRLDPQTLEYEAIAADERGLVRCEPLGLWLGIVEGRYRSYELPWLRWFDEAGDVVPTEAEDAVRKLEQARARVAELEARLAEFEKKR